MAKTVVPLVLWKQLCVCNLSYLFFCSCTHNLGIPCTNIQNVLLLDNGCMLKRFCTHKVRVPIGKAFVSPPARHSSKLEIFLCSNFHLVSSLYNRGIANASYSLGWVTGQRGCNLAFGSLDSPTLVLQSHQVFCCALLNAFCLCG